MLARQTKFHGAPRFTYGPGGHLSLALLAGPSTFYAKKVGHHLDGCVASIVQTRQPEAAFERLQQREVRVRLHALHAAYSVKGA
jgi:hypothetical protein